MFCICLEKTARYTTKSYENISLISFKAKRVLAFVCFVCSFPSNIPGHSMTISGLVSCFHSHASLKRYAETTRHNNLSRNNSQTSALTTSPATVH